MEKIYQKKPMVNYYSISLVNEEGKTEINLKAGTLASCMKLAEERLKENKNTYQFMGVYFISNGNVTTIMWVKLHLDHKTVDGYGTYS